MPEISTHILVAAVWGVLVILSWVGLGAVVDRFLWRGIRQTDVRHAPLGLVLGWGMATFICLGGVLLWLHLAIKLTLVLLTLSGALAGIWALWLRRADLREAWGIGRFPWLIHLPFVVMLLFLYVGGMQWPAINEMDDLPSYLPFIHEILQTGEFPQPFSLRRIVSYGGHTILQAQILSGTSDAYLCFLEKGICPILIAFLTLHLIAAKNIKNLVLAYLAISIMLLSTPFARVNAYCLNTGVVIFLTLFATLEYCNSCWREEQTINIGCWVTLGLLSSAAIALRTNFLPAIILIVLLYLLLNFSGSLNSWRQLLTGGILLCGTMFLALMPWALGQWKSSHTLLYPLMKGNYREIGIFSGNIPIYSIFKYFFSELIPNYLWHVLLGIALCITRRTSRIGIPYYCAAIASIFLIINFAPLGNSIHVYRYTYPILFAAEIGLIGLALQDQGTKLLKIICVTILLILAVTQSKNIANELSNNLNVIRISITPQPFVEQEILTQYKQAQNIIPEGEPILVMANYPHVFNFIRNKIYLIDLPGTCSPDPGMPMVRDSHLFNDYLRSQGISYIIHNDFNKAFTYCNRKFWNNELVNGEVLVKFMAANFISTMNNLEALDESGYTIGEYGILRVLRIY